MKTVTIARSLYNRWIKFLYNKENLPPMVTLLPEPFPVKPIIKEPSSVPMHLPFNNPVYFTRTGKGWQCSHKLIILDNIPCPVLPQYYRYEIEEGLKTIQQLEAILIKPKVTAQDVVRAGLGELGRRRATN